MASNRRWEPGDRAECHMMWLVGGTSNGGDASDLRLYFPALRAPIVDGVTTRRLAMKALVYHGPGQKAWEDVPRPIISSDTDAIVRVDAVTICGTDLHILKGDLPAVPDGRILGHEAVGTVESIGSGVQTVK